MQRRNFIGSTIAAASVTASVTASVATTAAAAQDTQWDIVIVGAGTAGLPAAIFASRRGARVLLIDAADDVGGTLHLANGQVAAAGTRTQFAKGVTDDTPDRHFDDIMHLSRGFADPVLMRRVADLAPDTINWLLDNGLTPLPDHPVSGDTPGRPAYRTARYIWGEGEGPDILKVVRKELEPEIASGRVTVELRARVSGFELGADGQIAAVRADRDGQSLRFAGRHFVLTTGGYAMSPEVFERLIGQPNYASGSYPHCLGDGLGMVESIGGALRGAELHRPGSGSILTGDRFPAKVYARFITAPQLRIPWEIWVDNSGQRFVREDEPDTYLRERGISKLPRFKYAIVFDEGIFRSAPPGVDKWTREKMDAHFTDGHPMFHRAATLDELAVKAGLDAGGLKATIARYNEGVGRDGADEFGRSYRPRRIERAPFYAIIHLGHSATSSTGVTVDADLRVVRADGTAIANLYAAGEVLGSGATLGNAFVPGMMLTPALTLGRYLGMTLPLAT